MKSIKNGLVMAAFIALFNCNKPKDSGEEILPFNSISENLEHEDRGLLNNISFDGMKDSALVQLYGSGYSILRRHNPDYHFFHREIYETGRIVKCTDIAEWGTTFYIDQNCDSDVDIIQDDATVRYVNDTNINSRYNSILSILKKDLVQKTWEHRWR